MNNIPDLVIVMVSYGAIAHLAKTYARKQDLEYAVPFAESLHTDLLSRWQSRTGRRGHRPAVSVYRLATRFA